ncbi:hypothetical protein Tco_0857368 [Tanacetum coccineum]|uniref:Uncharacterized protein n=1 Tax=Tanacetum coccineum TaxID=301880 RepID=A0ABQ5B625_9ASTR
MTESPLVDSHFAVPVFSPRDDPIACLNKAMSFLTVVASSRFPSTNNQLRTSSNPRNQTTIQDDRVTVQQSKRPRNATWYNEKSMLAEAQEAGQILDEEQLAFLIDPGVPDGQAIQTIIPNNATFQNEDLDTYDSDCDDISNAKVVLMANISNYGYDVISEVPHSETYLNDMENQGVHAMQDFEQPPAYFKVEGDGEVRVMTWGFGDLVAKLGDKVAMEVLVRCWSNGDVVPTSVQEFNWSNVPRVKLSSLSKSDDTFLSLQALLDLYYLFDGFIFLVWKILPVPVDGMNVESLWYGSQFPNDG